MWCARSTALPRLPPVQLQKLALPAEAVVGAVGAVVVGAVPRQPLLQPRHRLPVVQHHPQEQQERLLPPHRAVEVEEAVAVDVGDLAAVPQPAMARQASIESCGIFARLPQSHRERKVRPLAVAEEGGSAGSAAAPAHSLNRAITR